MAAMSEAQQHPDHHAHLDGLIESISEHHRRAVRRREDDALAEAADQAGFDLAADIAVPNAGHTPAAYDIESDIGIENEPPELLR
jgi:hypothetical protein